MKDGETHSKERKMKKRRVKDRNTIYNHNYRKIRRSSNKGETKLETKRKKIKSNERQKQ